MERRQAGAMAGGEEVREESSWRYPLTILAITLGLSALFLYLYVGPGVDDLQGLTPKPTVSDERTALTVGDTTFSVPASHTVYPADRRAGEREALPLWASWPRMDGYTPARDTDFTENRPDSRRIDVLLEARALGLSEAERLEALYLPEVSDRSGTSASDGLTRYDFPRSVTARGAYADRIMYVGEASDGGTAVLFCYRDDEPLVPPDCYRQYELTEAVSVKYYFKRGRLSQWREIDEGVRAFVEGLVAG